MTTVIWKDGSKDELSMDAEVLWVMYTLAMAGEIQVRLKVLERRGMKLMLCITEIDADATFSRAIMENYPTVPPADRETPIPSTERSAR